VRNNLLTLIVIMLSTAMECLGAQNGNKLSYGGHNSILHKLFISGAKNGQPVRRIAARIGCDPFAGSHSGLIQGKRRV
jgi:hypothetical protein